MMIAQRLYTERWGQDSDSRKIVDLKGAILTDEAKRSGRRRAPVIEDALPLKNKTRNRQRVATIMASEAPVLEELHDAYMLSVNSWTCSH